MNITNAQFTATGSITALVDGVQMSIPADPSNRHYAAMLEQGITPAEYVEPQLSLEDKRTTASMSRAKFLQACVAEGVIEPSVAEEASSGVWPSSFDGFLTGLPVDKRIEAKATWVDGQRVRRDSPILALIAAEQGVTDEQLDEMFGIAGG